MTTLADLLISILILLITLAIITVLLVRLCSLRKPDIFRYESERTFLDREKGGKKVFPFIDYDDIGAAAKSPLSLSVIVPAYNEEKRLPAMMDEALEYLEMRQGKDKKFTYEIIVVDDGSNDKTTAVGLDYVDKYGSTKIRVLTLFKNHGKGGAVRLGVLSSRGELVLFADADGATKFSDLGKLMIAMNESDCKPAIVIGSRAHLEEDAIASRSAIRTFLMHGFHSLVWFFAVRTVRDTQCGFKLFQRSTASLLFHWIHVERWAFDVEILHLAERLKLPIKEVAVVWTEIEGSKIVPVFSWLQMGRDVLKIFFLYAIGAWALPLQKKAA